MPIYEFFCRTCGAHSEPLIQKYEDPHPVCTGYEGEGEEPSVSHEPQVMEKVVGDCAVHFKGSWPDKDYKERRERFKRRNARIMKMSPEQQEGFKKIIDRPGAFGHRYLP